MHSARLSPDHLLRFLREHITPAAEPPAELQAAVLIPDPSELPVVSMDYSLAARLPPRLWAEALSFFSVRPYSPLQEPIGIADPELQPPGIVV